MDAIGEYARDGYIILFNKPNTMSSPISESSASGSTASAVIPYRPVVFFAPGNADFVGMRPGMGMIYRQFDV